MENAHLRMGLLEYERYTEKIATRIRVRVSHYIGEDDEAHLLSVFGNDLDVGAITAAIYEQARFLRTFPDGEMQEVSLGKGAICSRGSISIPGRKQSVRHISRSPRSCVCYRACREIGLCVHRQGKCNLRRQRQQCASLKKPWFGNGFDVMR